MTLKEFVFVHEQKMAELRQKVLGRAVTALSLLGMPVDYAEDTIEEIRTIEGSVLEELQRQRPPERPPSETASVPDVVGERVDVVNNNDDNDDNNNNNNNNNNKNNNGEDSDINTQDALTDLLSVNV